MASLLLMLVACGNSAEVKIVLTLDERAPKPEQVLLGFYDLGNDDEQGTFERSEVGPFPPQEIPPGTIGIDNDRAFAVDVIGCADFDCFFETSETALVRGCDGPFGPFATDLSVNILLETVEPGDDNGCPVL